MAFKPAWGGLKGYDDHQDDKRIDDEWGETQEKHDRRDQDKNVESGRSPPPKGMGRKSATKSSRTQEGLMWGREWGEDTMDFNAPSSTIGDDDPCDRDPDCKFDNRGDGKIKVCQSGKA